MAIALTVIASACSGDDTSDDAIRCSFEIGDERSIVIGVGGNVGDSATGTLLSETLRLSVFEREGKRWLRTEVVKPATIAPPNSSLAPGGTGQSEGPFPVSAKAGTLVLTGSTPVTEGLLTWTCVTR